MAAAGEEEEKYAFHSFGAQFCQLKVNRWTGEIRLQRITSVMDIGTVINMKTAHSQILGGGRLWNRNGSLRRIRSGGKDGPIGQRKFRGLPGHHQRGHP
jgi:hypothetical protein